MVHLGAAMLFGNDSIDHTLLDANVNGTYELAHAAAKAGVSRLVFASSDEVYPSLYAKYLPIDESHPREPYSFYGLTKVTGEELLHYEHRANGLPIAIARFSLVYEPWESVSPNGTLGGFLFYEKVKNFVRSRAGDAVADTLVAPGEPDPDLLLPRDEDGVPWMFHCCDVRDIVQGLTLLLDRPEAVGQAFNLSGPAPFSYGEADSLSRRAGQPDLPRRRHPGSPHPHSPQHRQSPRPARLRPAVRRLPLDPRWPRSRRITHELTAPIGDVAIPL